MKKFFLIALLLMLGSALAGYSQTPYGNDGYNYVTDTNMVSGRWFCLTVVDDIVIDTCINYQKTGANTWVNDTILNDTIQAGITLFWNIKKFKLNSGKAVLYRKID